MNTGALRMEAWRVLEGESAVLDAARDVSRVLRESHIRGAVVGGVVAWPASEAPRVLELYRTLAEAAPPELTLVAFMRPAPPAPWLPKDMHGKPIVALLACHSGSPEEGEKAVAPIKSFGKPIGDVLVRRPYLQLQSMLDATQPKGRRYYWKSEYLPRIEPALCGKVMDHAARIRSRCAVRASSFCTARS